MFFRLFVVASSVMCTSACHSPKDDFEKLCNAEELSGASSTRDAAERVAVLAKWLDSNVHTSAARELLSAEKTAERPAEWRAAASKAGYTGPCPFADR